jgi:glutamine synthetase
LASLIAGILDHLDTICTFTLPVDASYDRVGDGARGGGAWVSWGRENKDVPIRLCGTGGGFNIEVKALDGIANPYLALAAILAGGLTALESGKRLEMRNCLVTVSDLPDKEREEMGITTRMPKQSLVFEPEIESRMKFIRSWLPGRAWEYFKAAREVRAIHILWVGVADLDYHCAEREEDFRRV